VYYQRGRYFVEGLDADEQLGKIDVLDLDPVSFRAWVLQQLFEHHGVNSRVEPKGTGPRLPFRQAKPEVRRPDPLGPTSPP